MKMSSNKNQLARETLASIIDSMEEEIVQAVQQSIQIESTKGFPAEGQPFGEGPAKALQHALKLSDDLGFWTKNISNAIGYAEYGNGEEMVAVLGHLDVVPAGEGWIVSPFGGEIQNQIIWGRGAVDNKGPIIGALFAMKALQRSTLQTKRRIRVIFGTNEETGSQDVPYYTKEEEAPVMGFTPDASYPVIFAEKGILTISFSKTIDQSSGHVSLRSISGGSASNIVPSSAKAIISTEHVSEEILDGIGLSAHGSTPEQGKNAITDLLSKLSELDFCQDLRLFFAFLLRRIGEETDGASLGIQMQDEKSGSLTLNLATIMFQEVSGSLNASNSKITAGINIRYPATKNAEDILQIICKHTSEAGIDTMILSHKKPLYVNENSSLIRTLQSVYEQETGQTAELIAIGGGTYAKAMENIVAFGPIFPGQEDVTHQANEHITIENLMKNIKIMALAMYRLAQ